MDPSTAPAPAPAPAPGDIVTPQGSPSRVAPVNIAQETSPDVDYESASVTSNSGSDVELDLPNDAALTIVGETDGADASLLRENELFDVVVRMRNYLSGSKHRRGLTKHRNCFTGRQAVQWLVASRTCRNSQEAVKLGNELMDAKLIVGVTKAAKSKFEKRSHLYAYHLGVGPGISAARYYVSTELLHIESRMKDVRSVVDRHTAAVEALSSEHAAAMERVERVMSTLRMELSVLRASVVALVAHMFLPFVRSDAAAIMSKLGFSLSLDNMLLMVGLSAAIAVAISSLLGLVFNDNLTQVDEYDGITTNNDGMAKLHHRPSLRDNFEDTEVVRTPSFFQKSAGALQRTASRIIERARRHPHRPEDRADPPPLSADDWVDSPCALRFSPADAQMIQQKNQLPDNMVRAQIPFEIDSELFKGKMVVYMRGLDNEPHDIFNGRMRTIQITLQGKFKREIAMDELVIGQTLSRPLKNLPSRWLLSLCARVIRSFGEIWGMKLSMPTDEKPFMLAPVALAAQALSCEEEGDVQDISGPIIENCSSIPLLADVTTASQRQKILKKLIIKSKKRSKTTRQPVPVFDTERVWTFGFWQSQINFLTYRVDLGVGTFNLLRIMNGQPLCFCASSLSGEILFRMEVWHKDLLKAAQEAHEKIAQQQLRRRSSLDIRGSFVERLGHVYND